MTASDSTMFPLPLPNAARADQVYALLDRLLVEQKTVYLLANRELSVIAQGGTCVLFTGIVLPADLLDLIPELVGCEDIIEEIFLGQLADFQLENLNRSDDDNNTHYLNVTLVCHQEEEHRFLLIIISDNTPYTKTQQILTQQRNELSLLKHRLDESHQQLEFILQHYVPHQVSRALIEQRINPTLGGEVREVTLLFADLRNYTRISEQLTPTETIELLHLCLDMAVSAIVDAGGVILNYMGDAVMAIFNAPDDLPHHAAHAIRAGLNLQETAKVYQEQRLFKLPYDLPVHFGVGINTGEAVVGNVGAGGHYQYTAIGDTVNVASRLCSHARGGQVLVGEKTYFSVAQQRVRATALPSIQFKGKSHSLTVYEIEELN
ncbi:adenylate/guanylate cyclase domain-containing protein [Thioflexithrix psekupsensis]|nr:adenylate/guanylate cyclase domain-containing protein [Thioflexithrix psekupsensis]